MKTYVTILNKFYKLKLLFALLFIVSQSFSQDQVYNLRCCDKLNPVGVDETPYFGWYINDPDDDEIQTSYEILVASDTSLLNAGSADMWSSGKLVSGKQNYVYYNGNPLLADNKYYWKVRVWDKDNTASPYSEVSSFQTGLFENSDWEGAKWIKRKNSSVDDYTYYRKTFATEDKSIEQAVVYVTAVHDFILYLNDSLVGKGPAYHYAQYQYYNAYDITSLINQGEDNTLACFTHWYGGGQGRPTSERGFLLKTVITFDDESTLIIGTDSTWKHKQATAWKVPQNKRNGEGIGYIERIDSRNIISDWYTSAYNDSAWANVTVIGEHPVNSWTGVLQPNLTRLVEEEINPLSITALDEDSYVIDLGKIYAGVPKIEFSGGTEGTVVTITGGFVLNEDGSVSTEITQSTDMKNKFILNGETAVFQPFVYLGMRYIQVDNSPNTLTTENVSFITRHYELDPARSEFNSSDEMLDSVWELMKHSLILGSQESFVDTPTREKGGFLGDGWSIGAAAMSTMGDRVMNKRILLEFLDSQDQYWLDGRLNAVYPNVDGGRDIPDYTQMYPFWVWDYYMQTGDSLFLSNNYSKIKKVVEYVNDYKDESTGLIHNLDGGGGSYLYGIIDWPDQMRYGYDMDVVTRTVQDAYAYYDFDIMSKIAEIVDSTDDQTLYQQRADNIKENINKQLIREEGVYIDGLLDGGSQSTHASQQANMVPLALGIVPEGFVDSVANQIMYYKMSSGMVTLRWLPEAIGEADKGAHLVDLFTNTEWDGWAKCISLGATATWESWDAIDYPSQSLSHPWGAAGIIGMQKYILGITALKPQHELVQIKPLDCQQKLSYVSGSLPSDRGNIDIEWERSDTIFSMSFTIPDNITAQVYVPKSETSSDTVLVNGEIVVGADTGNYIYVGEMGSGSYTIEREAAIYIPSSDTVRPPYIEVSIINTQVFDDIKIYPNPAHNTVLLDWGEKQKAITIRIFNSLGKQLDEINHNNLQTCEIDLAGLESGIYFCELSFADRETSTVRMVKN